MNITKAQQCPKCGYMEFDGDKCHNPECLYRADWERMLNSHNGQDSVKVAKNLTDTEPS
ncbi:MAG TPA: hypothetical protein VMY35_09790 [Phycisphaerae bacterium]|nr:hypothetical protein [Phycisphaerae bacterium]